MIDQGANREISRVQEFPRKLNPKTVLTVQDQSDQVKRVQVESPVVEFQVFAQISNISCRRAAAFDKTSNFGFYVHEGYPEE